jgi:hypothetical protein
MANMNGAIATALLGLALCTPVLAKDIIRADYSLTARLLSSEENTSTTLAPVRNSSTGVITGSTIVNNSTDREELQIGDTVYITSLWGRGRIEGKVGDSFPAQLGRKHRVTVIYLLSTDKQGKAKAVCLEVTGQRVKQ